MSGISFNPSSYKDPSGFVFKENGVFYRQVNQSYASHFDLLIQSGLYTSLVSKEWLLPHVETDQVFSHSENLYKTLLPQQLSFISYVYEWSFDMLKDAALLTLDINLTAIDAGMILKDATPYNIQFIKGNPVFIDTLSFEKYDESKPWIAYRQFCEMFLFPLYLEYYLKTDIRKIMSAYIDGIPAAATARLLPFRSRFNIGVWLNVYLQNIIKGSKQQPGNIKFNKTKLTRLLQYLRGTIQGLRFKFPGHSVWSNYYDETILSQQYLKSKEEIVRSFLADISWEKAIDIGANDGYFTRILAERATEVIAIDLDGQCINGLYGEIRKGNLTNVFPLIVDISNPSPAVGFNNEERISFLDRVQPDLQLALAFIHHMVIGKNIPLIMIAEFFNRIAPLLIVEFIPKEDPKVQEMIGERTSLFEDYTRNHFEEVIFRYFKLLRREEIPGSCRTLYLLERK